MDNGPAVLFACALGAFLFYRITARALHRRRLKKDPELVRRADNLARILGAKSPPGDGLL